MKVEQIYTGCLAEAAYYIESNGEAAVIDPLRESKPYLERAAKDNAKIKYVLETHFHADFVSGHLDLAAKTGATIIFGPTAQPGYPAHIATDGEILPLGNVQIKVLHTPGHTMESSSYLLIDENGKETALFSGDTLLIGDVGRPDLAVKSDVSEVDLAGYLYDSLHSKVLTLPDDVIIYPGHGAGSACGKNMSKETTDTLGNQKLFNYALQTKTKEEFVEKVLDGLVTPPQYFPKNAVLNKMGYESFDEVFDRGIQALSAAAFEAAANETEALIIDIREAQVFAKKFIPNSINIGIDGSFAPWVGALIPDLQQPILLVADADQVEEAVTRLARVGYDKCIGYLKDGISDWEAAGFEVDSIATVSVENLSDLMTNEAVNVLDVRKESEYNSQHVVGVQNFPLDFINQNMAELDRSQKYYIHCASGYRSMIATSILQARGYDIVDVKGGFKAIEESGRFETTAYVCPTTML